MAPTGEEATQPGADQRASKKDPHERSQRRGMEFLVHPAAFARYLEACRAAVEEGPARRGAARRRAGVTAAREGAYARGSVAWSLALRRIRLGRASRLSGRARLAASHGARPAAGRLRGTLDDGTLAVRREQHRIGARLRNTRRARHEGAMVRDGGAVAGGIDLRPRLGDGRVISGVVAALGLRLPGNEEQERERD